MNAKERKLIKIWREESKKLIQSAANGTFYQRLIRTAKSNALEKCARELEKHG